MNKGIPNLNTISTYIERLVICNVKRSQFKYRLETQDLDKVQSDTLEYMIGVQDNISKDIRNVILESLEKSFKYSSYEYYKENRSLT